MLIRNVYGRVKLSQFPLQGYTNLCSDLKFFRKHILTQISNFDSPHTHNEVSPFLGTQSMYWITIGKALDIDKTHDIRL